MKSLRFLKYVGFGILGLAFCVLAIYVTMSLWNWLIPALFHGPLLTFWQTAGLFLLSKILLSGFAPHGHPRRFRRDWHHKYNEKYRSCCHDESSEPSTQQEGQVTSDK
jgi:hypothetical protein